MDTLYSELLQLPMGPIPVKQPVHVSRTIHPSLPSFLTSVGRSFLEDLIPHVGIPTHRFTGFIAVFSGTYEGFTVHFVYDRKRDTALEQAVFQRISQVTHLFPDRRWRCPIVCIMYTRPRRLFPSMDVVTHKNEAHYFSSSGVTNSDGIIVSKKNGLLGLLTHEMVHYLGQFRCYRDEGITDFIASMLEARFLTKDNTKATLIKNVLDQEEIARSRLRALASYFQAGSSKDLERISRQHKVATTIQYIMTRVMLHDHYIPGLFRAMQEGTVPSYADLLKKSSPPLLGYDDTGNTKTSPVVMEYYSRV